MCVKTVASITNYGMILHMTVHSSHSKERECQYVSIALLKPLSNTALGTVGVSVTAGGPAIGAKKLNC
jgi:hypothetical protein